MPECLCESLQLVILTGAAKSCTTKLIFLPGAAEAQIVSVEDESNNELAPARWSRLVNLSLSSVGESFTGAHDLVDIARFGHFTRHELVWEQISAELSINECIGDLSLIESRVVAFRPQPI